MGDSETVYISLCGLFLVLVVLIVVYTRGTQSRRFCQKNGDENIVSDSVPAVTHPATSRPTTHSTCKSHITESKEFECSVMHHTQAKNTTREKDITFNSNKEGTYFECKYTDDATKSTLKNVYTHFKTETLLDDILSKKMEPGPPQWLSSKESTKLHSKDGCKKTKFEGLQCKKLNLDEARQLCMTAHEEWHLSGSYDSDNPHSGNDDDFGCDIFKQGEGYEAMLCEGTTNADEKDDICLETHTHLVTVPSKNMKFHNMVTWTNGALHTALKCTEK
jgi:hypothetical protein